MSSKLMTVMLKTQMGTLLTSVEASAQRQEDTLAEKIGAEEAKEMVDEAESILRQLDTASAGRLTKAMLRMSAIGAVQSLTS